MQARAQVAPFGCLFQCDVFHFHTDTPGGSSLKKGTIMLARALVFEQLKASGFCSGAFVVSGVSGDYCLAGGDEQHGMRAGEPAQPTAICRTGNKESVYPPLVKFLAHGR
jgi:hypothetical protein